MNLSEKETREREINPLLEKVGWNFAYVKEEVNSVKSDFKAKKYEHFSGEVEKGVDKFIDYVLLDEDNSPLAIIEAKRFSEDEQKGHIQARTYAKDIEHQTGEKIQIFLTNGRKWYLIDQDGIERDISGPFSQEDLHRRRILYQNRRKLSDINIKGIVDRTKSVIIVKKLAEHFESGHRKALVCMATGTGKTRVAMGLIDIFRKANFVKNVLFIADRVLLANQADEMGFKEYFSGEPSIKVHEGGFTTTKTLYCSTLQTLMSRDKNKKRFFERFSPGFFDFIIFDEAHRSYYEKPDILIKYFDALKIGLTATPSDKEKRNTFGLFGCDYKKPTVEYSYDEAVADTVLVHYIADIIDTKVLSLGIRTRELSKNLKNQLRKQELDPDKEIEFTGPEFNRVFMDDKTNELIVMEFMARCYRSNENLPCKSIFFCASRKHAQNLKRVFDRIFPQMGSNVQVITSDLSKYKDEFRRFQQDSEPRIALSVGVLDTGVDIPEVCNLVFVKPIFSEIRFWQMLGRGTRNTEACKRHLEWLPNNEKENFKILDFKFGSHSNVKYHHLEHTREEKIADDVNTRMFSNLIFLLEKDLDERQTKIVSDFILKKIEALNKDSFIVRERRDAIDKIEANKFSLKKFIKELKDDIKPLMKFEQGGNVRASSFTSKSMKLFGFILENKLDNIEGVKYYVQEMISNVIRKENLTEVKANRDKLLKIMRDEFWNELSFEDVEFLIKEIAPLMKYFEPMPRKMLQIDAPDMTLRVERIEKEMKEDEKFKEFREKNPILKRLKSGEGITSEEIFELERQLSNLNPVYTIENIQKYQKIDFVLFLRKMLDLSVREYDPKEIIEQEFDRFIIGRSGKYNSTQLEFLHLLKKVFAERKYIHLEDFAKSPLAEERPTELFRIDELKEIVQKCRNIRVK